eukprot:2431182-Amphidinium_carterae.1
MPQGVTPFFFRFVGVFRGLDKDDHDGMRTKTIIQDAWLWSVDEEAQHRGSTPSQRDITTRKEHRSEHIQ